MIIKFILKKKAILIKTKNKLARKIKTRTKKIIKTFFNVFIAVFATISLFLPQIINADFIQLKVADLPSIKSKNSLICKMDGTVEYAVAKKIKMLLTAYSSAEEQTDSTPFITASNKQVADGIVANNMLAFGSKVRMPELYGDKIFIVEDRMHQRKGKYHIDIWMPSYQEAKNFGAKITYIEVLEN